MITCPNCKTANRDGSRFCNACGASLASASSAEPRAETPAEAPTEDAPVQTPEADMPAWLRELRAAAHAAPAEAFADTPAASAETPSAAGDEIQPSPEDEMPDWLRALQPRSEATARSDSIDETASAGPAPVAAADSDQDAQATDADLEQEEEPHAEAVTDEDVPAWLSSLAPEDFKLITDEDEPAPADEVEPEELPSAESGELPEWLKELRRSGTPEDLGATISAPSETAQTPAPEAGTAGTEPPSGRAALAEAPVPEWLADLNETPSVPTMEAGTLEASEPLRGEAPEESAVAETDAAALAEGEAPEWLKELGPSPSAPAEHELSDVALDELPDWLKPGVPPKAPETPVPEAAAPAAAEGAPAGEVPAWVQSLKPGAISTPEGEPIETSGLLAGIRGALPVESALAAPHRRHALPAVSPGAPRREPGKRPIAGFAELSTPQPTPPDAGAAEVPKRRGGCSLHLLLALAIVLAVAVAFLPLPLLADLRGVNITGRQSTLDFYQTINQIGSLRQGALALVGFDYGAGSRAELDPQARAALLHLFQNKQRVVAVSFVPEGGQIAQGLLESARPSGTGFDYPYRYGGTHINFGFVPGGTAGMRRLVQDKLPGDDFAGAPVEGLALARDLKSLDNADLLIVFTDDGEQLRRWVEQLGRDGKPLIAGVSAAAAPVAAPYYESGQLHGLLAGQRGAAEYEGYLGRPASASATLDAISYVVLVLVTAIGAVLVGRMFARAG